MEGSAATSHLTLSVKTSSSEKLQQGNKPWPHLHIFEKRDSPLIAKDQQADTTLHPEVNLAGKNRR